MAQGWHPGAWPIMGQQAGARPSSDHVDHDVSPGQGRLTRRRLGRWWGSTPPSDTLASLKTSPLYVLIAAVLAVVAPGLVLGIRRPAVIRIRIRHRRRHDGRSTGWQLIDSSTATRSATTSTTRWGTHRWTGSTPTRSRPGWVACGPNRLADPTRGPEPPGASRPRRKTLPTPTRPYEAKLRDRIQPTAQSIRSGDGDLEPA